eukprot:Amastigsp_a2209_55.p7 type:complete len:100 gc:universal Amastigsp_a2209_55:1919-2218(+)
MSGGAVGSSDIAPSRRTACARGMPRERSTRRSMRWRSWMSSSREYVVANISSSTGDGATASFCTFAPTDASDDSSKRPSRLRRHMNGELMGSGLWNSSI